MNRILTAALILIALAGAANALGLGLGNRFGKLGALTAAPNLTPPVTTGSALLVDNTNPALLVDGVNPACLVGGC